MDNTTTTIRFRITLPSIEPCDEIDYTLTNRLIIVGGSFMIACIVMASLVGFAAIVATILV